MPNNGSEQIRSRLYEEYEDSLFKLLMHEAAEKEGQIFLEEKEKLNNNPEFQPSQQTIQEFAKQLDAHLKKRKDCARRRRARQVLNKVAIVIMLIVLIVFGATAVTVQAVRMRVLNFLMDIEHEYTSFQLKESSGSSKSGGIIIDWNQAYVPTYIPEGFKISSISDGNISKTIEFTNSQGSLLTYMESSEGIRSQLDTENASAFETVTINGHEGTVVVKNSLVTVIWAMDDRMYMIRGQVEKDIAIKMAEGVRYID